MYPILPRPPKEDVSWLLEIYPSFARLFCNPITEDVSWLLEIYPNEPRPTILLVSMSPNPDELI